MLTLFLAVFATAVPVMFLVRLLRKVVSPELIAATILIAMSFIYVGFALKENPTASIIESIVALMFYSIAMIGYTKEKRILPLGILFHGIWDFIHHYTSVAYDAPTFWPAYCLIVDVIWSVYFHAIFNSSKSS